MKCSLCIWENWYKIIKITANPMANVRSYIAAKNRKAKRIKFPKPVSNK